MRILQVTHSLAPEVGGPVEHIKQITPVLQGMGHDVELACLDAPGSKWLSDISANVHAFGPGITSHSYSFKFLEWLRKNGAKYDAVIVRGMWQYSSYGTWQALRKTDTPYFLFPHGMLDPWFNKKYPLKRLKKQLYWLWGGYPVIRDAKTVLFTSDQERLLARESFRPYRCVEKVVKYGTATPPQKGDEFKGKFFLDYPELKGKKILLFFGRLHEKKGCDLLIKAFSETTRNNKNVVLFMAGPSDGAYLGALKQLARDCGVFDRIVWAGMLSGDKKWAAIYAADLFVLPSHQENFGIAVVEALGCGIPVVVTNKVNIWNAISKSSAGIVVEDDEHAISGALDQFFNFSCAESEDMAKEARECFRENFEIHAAAISLMDHIAGKAKDYNE